MASELKLCPFCSKTMMLRSALWPSEGDADAIIHADPTDCPMLGFSDGSADGSIIEKWNCSLSNEDDFPSDGSCVRCGSVPRNANGLCNTCLDEDAERLENTRPTPVAPVSPDTDGKCGELETVMRRYRGTDWPEHYPWAYLNESECQGEAGPRWIVEELCLRSQVVELLAAKDETIRLLHQHINDWEPAADAGKLLAAERSMRKTAEQRLAQSQDDLKQARADNAAQAARIEELKATAKKSGVCMTCLTGCPDTYGCSDCLNTGWEGGSPPNSPEDIQSLFAGMISDFSRLKRHTEALEAKLAAAQEALEPFADHAKERAVDAQEWRDTDTVKIVVTIGDLRKTRAARVGKPS